MNPRVTAIVVAHRGGPRLQRTLDALAAQTRQPDAVIAIDCGSTDDAAQLLAAARPTQLLNVPEKLPFGAAVRAAVQVLTQAGSGGETLWLLGHDTAPEPGALEALLAALEVSPSVAVVGPKLVDAEDAAFIHEFGEAMTPLGASIPLVENELDQAQHDDLSDVLAVSAAGMLVRTSVWEKLDGFDPALPGIDDGLDFCTRARLAGFRVTLVPQARVAIHGDGLVGPRLSPRWSGRRRTARDRRRAQLHRRMVYAPAWMVPLHWLTLVPLAILRSLLRLVRKEPGSVEGELSAAFRVAFSGTAVGAARRRLARAKTVGWSAIAPLRVPFAEARRTHALRREAALVSQQGERQDLDFFGSGGGWTVLAALVVGIALFYPIAGSGALSGGGLLPLDSSVGQLWAKLGYGWRDIGLGFVGAADPFSVILAVLGSITFWQPSTALVALYLLAIPLTAFGAWLATARLTVRASLRAFGALAYALAPTLLVAMQEGRPAAMLVHILLPWLFFAGLAARRSWAASAATALLAAATVACAPVLIPALVIAWVAVIVFAGRRAARIVFIPLPAVVLFLPLVVQQTMRGALLSVFADPGVPLDARQTPGWQLALGFPDGTLGGWHQVMSALPLPETAANILVPILLAPLGVLALLAMFLRGSVRAIVALLVALAGFLTAVASLHVLIAVSGSVVVPIWPGSAVSLYWLGLTGAAVIALSALGRAAIAPALVAMVTLAIVAVPPAIATHQGRAAVTESDGRTMPAVVTAKAAAQPRTGTLRITPQANGGISAVVVRGSGQTLETQSTLSSTQRELRGDQDDLATLAGNLASRSGYDGSADLKKLGIDFVLVTPPATVLDETDSAAAAVTSDRAAVALDANPLLAPVGDTPSGRLWAFDRGTTTVPAAAQIPAGAGDFWRVLVLVMQGVVIGITLLMAIPTSHSVDRVSELNGRRQGRAKLGPGPRAVAPDDAVASPPPAGLDPLSESPGEDAVPLAGEQPQNAAVAPVAGEQLQSVAVAPVAAARRGEEAAPAIEERSRDEAGADNAEKRSGEKPGDAGTQSPAGEAATALSAGDEPAKVAAEPEKNPARSEERAPEPEKDPVRPEERAAEPAEAPVRPEERAAEPAEAPVSPEERTPEPEPETPRPEGSPEQPAGSEDDFAPVAAADHGIARADLVADARAAWAASDASPEPAVEAEEIRIQSWPITEGGDRG